MKKKEAAALSRAKIVIKEHSWMGPVHVRATPVREYHLLIDDGKEKVMDFMSLQNPVFEFPAAFTFEGRVSKKWMDFEGKLRPGQFWNSLKEMRSNVLTIFESSVTLEREKEDGLTVFYLKIPKLGSIRLKQEEAGSVFYEWSKESEMEERQGFFVLDKHSMRGGEHYDVRFKLPDWGYLMEATGMEEDPSKKEKGERQRVVFKHCFDLEWLNKEFKKGKRKVAGEWTEVERLDQGEFTLLEQNPYFWSFIFAGRKLRGYYALKKEGGKWYFFKSRLPSALSDPLKGEPLSPPRVTEKKGWPYFRVDIYDPRDFTRTEPDEKVSLYLKDVKVPEGVKVLIGLYPRPDRIHGARVMSVFFDTDKWSKEEALEWIKKNKLAEKEWDMVRRKA